MSPKRQDSFVIALDTLRCGLREGAYGYGTRLTATEIAHDLSLSPTPVREALSRLVGEGLVEDRRGQGFFVPRLTACDLADLYRLSLVYLGLAFEARLAEDRVVPGLAAQPPSEGVAAVILSERLFRDWVSTTTRVVAGAHRRVQDQLAFARRFEPLLMPDLGAEVMRLIDLADRRQGPQLLASLEAFHARRIDASPRLASLLESHAAPVK
jgi:DNA-binding transcriptional ArsR family regulator